MSQIYNIDIEGDDKTVSVVAIGNPVQTVNGYIGDVVLTTTDIAEGTNLYYTDTRVDANFASKTTDDLAEGTNLYYTDARVNQDIDTRVTKAFVDALDVDADTLDGYDGGYYLNYTNFNNKPFIPSTTDDITEGTNLYYTDARVDANISTKTTDDISEGTGNKYFTDERVDDRVATLLVAGDYTTIAYDDVANTLTISGYGSVDFDSDLAAKTTDDLSEGTTNQYYTEARVDANIASKTTDDISEGTNLYYTDTRARNSVSASGDLTYTPLTGEFNVVTYKTADFNTDFATKSTSDLTEGTNLYYTTARANTDFDTRLATKSTTDLTEGTRLYYTQARFDNAFGNKTTTDLNEGTNLYYTTARANNDFDTRLATKSTDDVSEGVTNKYYTEARVDANIAGKTTDDISEGTNLYYTEARVDSNFASKSTTDLTEGTNLYYTEARVNANIASKSTDDISEGSNQYYTDARANSAIDTRVNKVFVDNLNVDADTLDGQHGTYYLNYNNLTNKPDLSVLNEIEFYASAASFPATGAGDRVYIAQDTGYMHRWNGSGYTQLTDQTAIWGEVTGTLANQTDLQNALNAKQDSSTAYNSADFDSDFATKTTTDLTEGTNKYYTDERVDDRVANLLTAGSGIQITYDDVGNALTIESLVSGYGSADFDSDFAAATTDDLSEGATNQYFTNERVDDRVANLIVGGNNITATYNDTAGTLTIDGQPGYTATDFDSDFATKTTTDLSEGSNLYYTQGRFDSAFGAKTTTNLSEGSNLYYTTARANSAIDSRVTKAFVDLLNVDADTLDGINSTGFATSAQGSLANSALQPGDIGSTVQSHSTVLDNTTASYTTALNNKLNGIEAGATADQTKADIDALGINASELNGEAGSYYLNYNNLTNKPTNVTANSTSTTVGGLTSRYDGVTNTLYLRNDGGTA